MPTIGLSIERVETLLLIAAIVAMMARRIRTPYTVGLVVAGMALAVSPISREIQFTRDLVYTGLLPPLVFEAAYYIPWRELRRELPVVLTLATVGVVISALITAVGVSLATGWALQVALLFGFLIAATDPISVIATFREAGVGGRLRILVEAESLLNDGTAVVTYGIVLAAIQGASTTIAGAVTTFIVTVAGGVLSGAGVAGAVLLLAGRTEDHLVEITFTTVAAYGSFLFAEHFHFSGVLAAMTTGIIVGNVGPLGAISPRGREAVNSFWEYVAFVANSLVFLLIGIREARLSFAGYVPLVAAAIGAVLLGRAGSVYLTSLLFARSRHQVPLPYQHVLFWGGLRGALALALVLGIPPEIPHRKTITILAFAVVAFSVIVQGLTMTPLLRRLGVLSHAETPEDEG